MFLPLHLAMVQSEWDYSETFIATSHYSLYLLWKLMIIMAKYLKYTRNFYFIFTVLFILWMVFIDSNDIMTQFTLRSKLSDLEEQKEFYQERKEKIKAEGEELLSNYELLEKFAREKYLMKRKSEDLYVIVEE